MDIKALVVTDLGNDILRVQAVVAAFPDRAFEARGWISATVNHYDEHPNQEGADSVEVSGRNMSAQEIQAYALRLLAEQHPSELAGLIEKTEPRVLHADNPEHLESVLQQPNVSVDESLVRYVNDPPPEPEPKATPQPAEAAR